MSDNSTQDKFAETRIELAAALDAAQDHQQAEVMTVGEPTSRGRSGEPSQAATSHATGQPPYATSQYAADTDVHLLDYVKVLYKRRWTAGTAFLIVLLGVTVYTFTTTPIFEARTRLLIESDNPNVVSFKEVIDEGQTRTDYYQTQYNILQSRALARKTIDTLKAWDSPLLGAPKAAASFSIGALVAPIAGLVGSSDETAQAPEADETATQSRAIDSFLAQVAVSPIRNSRLVDVKFRSPDAAFATKAANALAKNYIEQNLEYKFSASKEATGWLEERLAEQRKQVEAAEAVLQQYREQNDAISLEDRENIVVQKLTDLNTAVTKAKTERIQKEAMYRQLAAIQRTAAIDTFPAILGNQYIQQQKAELATLQRQQAQMADKLGERHPEMIRVRSAIETGQAKLRTEIAKVIQSVRTDYQAALVHEQTLSAVLDQQKGEALAMNRKAIDYSVLERDVQSSKQMYESLLQRAKETGISGELKTSNIRIVDPAEVPKRASRPNITLNLLIGAWFGLIAGLGLCFGSERLDSRVKSPEEIKTQLRIPFIGMIPDIKSAGRADSHLLSTSTPPAFVEAFRTIRTNVLFSSAAETGRIVVVTSTTPAEGKTLVSSNLAAALALAGHRVLLIDADMRRPKAHEVFGMPQEPGLSNVLTGNSQASESVKCTDVPNLWLVASGRIPPNPAELAGSRRYRDFLQSLTEQFDWIIIDSPPVMAVTDASVLARSARNVLFVVRADATSCGAARVALQQLDAAKPRIIGAVLNQVQLDKHSFYYSHYYKSEYSSAYARSSTS